MHFLCSGHRMWLQQSNRQKVLNFWINSLENAMDCSELNKHHEALLYAGAAYETAVSLLQRHISIEFLDLVATSLSYTCDMLEKQGKLQQSLDVLRTGQQFFNQTVSQSLNTLEHQYAKHLINLLNNQYHRHLLIKNATKLISLHTKKPKTQFLFH